MLMQRTEGIAPSNEVEWMQVYIDALGRTPKEALRGGMKATNGALLLGEISQVEADIYFQFFLGNYIAARAAEYGGRCLGMLEHSLLNRFDRGKVTRVSRE